MKKKISNSFKKINTFIKHLNRVISYVHKNSDMLYIIIFFDIFICSIFYGATIDEYKVFEFYKISYDKRKTYLTTLKYEFLRDKLINKKIYNNLSNKDIFIKRFKDDIKSEIINIKDFSFKEAECLIIDNKELICRSSSSPFVSSCKVYNVSNFRSPAFMLEEMKKNKLYNVEKVFIQHKLLKEITDNLITINVILIRKKNGFNVLATTLTFKENDEIVKGYIDLKNKKTRGHFRYKSGKYYKEEVINYDIPCLDEIVNYALKVSKELTEFGLLELDFCINNHSSIYFMDANVWNDFVFIQIPEYLNNRVSINNKVKNRD